MKVSIITASYNSEDTIEETILSVIGQDYKGIEYIVVDGASTDGTLKILEKYQNRIGKLISEPDKGISDAFNKGILAATGEIIGIIGSDDMLLPGAIKTLVENMDEETDIFYGDGVRLKRDGTRKAYQAKHHSKLKTQMALIHPSTFVRARAYRSYGLYNEGYKTCMDRELLLRMLIKGAKFKYLPKAFSIYRMGGVSDRYFSTLVRKEREQLSLQYGRGLLVVKAFSLLGLLKHTIRKTLSLS